jgi:tripartite-type tricarboxylate transporter receptor subunit TctC
MSRWRPIAAALVVSGWSLCAAAAQDYPAKPIKMIVPFIPGSPVDVLARLVSNHLSPRLGQPIVLENKPGAGTTIGTKIAAGADPDGYTLMIAATSFVISSVMYPNAGYDPLKSFDAVAFLARSPQVLVTTHDVPARTLKEFISYAHANSGKLNFGFGLGTLPQILGEYFKLLTKSNIASIPYKGGEQVRVDMLGGRIQMNFGPPPSVGSLIRQGKFQPLAVTTETRYAGLPDVPTFKESGLPQMSISFTAGFVAPAGLPQPVLRKLNEAVNETLRSPELVAAMDKIGFVPEPWSIAQYEAFLAEEVKTWPGILKETGVTLK